MAFHKKIYHTSTLSETLNSYFMYITFQKRYLLVKRRMCNYHLPFFIAYKTFRGLCTFTSEIFKITQIPIDLVTCMGHTNLTMAGCSQWWSPLYWTLAWVMLRGVCFFPRQGIDTSHSCDSPLSDAICVLPLFTAYCQKKILNVKMAWKMFVRTIKVKHFTEC